MTNSHIARTAALPLLFLGLSACDNRDRFVELLPIVPILESLPRELTIGSTVDPANGGDLNPYGLAVAPVGRGPIRAGDLVACNFNDGATNTQGMGTTIVGLSPGNTSATTEPYTIAQSPSLRGCSEVIVLPDGNLVATASQANQLVLVTPQGTPGSPAVATVSLPYAADSFSEPWGLTFAQSPSIGPALYVSDAKKGVIDRISLGNSDAQTGFAEIATGFSVNNGPPGSILGPAGLTYDPYVDTLYVVDSNANRVVALSNVSSIGAGGVVVSGASFSGPSAAHASIVAAGSPLNGPISAALLFSGNLVVGNTLDPNGTNLITELVPGQGVFGQRVVDFTQGGALFGIATAGNAATNQVIYFNDDNDNTVKVLSN